MADRPRGRDPARRVKVGILLSGRGSNMQALVAASAAGGYAVAAVASDRPDAAGIAWTAERGIATLALSPRNAGGKTAFEARVDGFLREAGVELVALAGYMRLLSPGFVGRWPGRILNIHPSLLPLYKGLDTHARALAAGDAEAGCSVHVVTDELDAGAVLGRSRVPVHADDTPETLAARVLAAEHLLYPRILSEYARTMTDPLARVRATALQLPEAEERPQGSFAVAGEAFARVDGTTLHVRGERDWTAVPLGPDADWPAIDEAVARGWEMVAPAGLLEAGGR